MFGISNEENIMVIRNCLNLLSELSEIETILTHFEQGKLQKSEIEKIMKLLQDKKKAS